MTMFSRRERSPDPLMTSRSFCITWVYHFRCISLIPTLRIVSRLGGSDFSTSTLRRRRRKGRSSRWSCFTTSCFWSSVSIWNQSSNFSAEEKTSGRRKFRSAQSSCRLFCRGVPVISMRLFARSTRTTRESSEFSFLMRCASSITM